MRLWRTIDNSSLQYLLSLYSNISNPYIWYVQKLAYIYRLLYKLTIEDQNSLCLALGHQCCGIGLVFSKIINVILWDSNISDIKVCGLCDPLNVICIALCKNCRWFLWSYKRNMYSLCKNMKTERFCMSVVQLQS